MIAVTAQVSDFYSEKRKRGTSLEETGTCVLTAHVSHESNNNIYVYFSKLKESYRTNGGFGVSRENKR